MHQKNEHIIYVATTPPPAPVVGEVELDGCGLVDGWMVNCCTSRPTEIGLKERAERKTTKKVLLQNYIIVFCYSTEE